MINDICEQESILFSENLKSGVRTAGVFKQTIIPCSTGDLRNCSLSISSARYHFGQASFHSRVARRRSIEFSRTIVLVMKATRCHWPWISAVVEAVLGFATKEGGSRKGWHAMETREQEFSSCVFVYRCSLSEHMVPRRGSPLQVSCLS